MSGHTLRPYGRDASASPDAVEDRAEAWCFSDEVIVDFPSVAPAVERMRRAFVAEERADALMATISLSAREARVGATVPLAVPVSCTCRACGGRGELWAEPCGGCNGSGTELRHHHLHVFVPAGVSHGARFRLTLTARHNPPTRVELHVLVA